MQQITIEDLAVPVRQIGRTPRKHVIIADAGDGAWLLVSDQPRLPHVGARFVFRGQEWEIVAYRQHARAFVAELFQH